MRELGLAAGTLLIGVAVLCGAEWVARRLDPRFLDRTRGATVYSEIYGWALRPGFSGEIHGVTTNLNRRGFRGMDARSGESARTAQGADARRFAHFRHAGA